MIINDEYFEKSVPKKWGRFKLKSKAKKFYKTKYKYIKRYKKKLSHEEIIELKESFLLLKTAYKKEKNKIKLRKQFIDTKKTLNKYLPDMLNRPTAEFIEVLLSAIIIVFFLRAFLVDTYHIPTGSMISTIMPGDRIFASKFIYGFSIPWTNYKFFEWNSPEDGNIIIFEPPQKKYDKFAYEAGMTDNFVKRMIAKEGDRLEIKDSIIYINDRPIKRKLINEKFFFDDLDQREMQGRSSVGIVYEENYGGHKYTTVKTNGLLDYFGIDKDGKNTTNPANIVKGYTVPENSIFLLSDLRDIYSMIPKAIDSRIFGALKTNHPNIKYIDGKEVGDVVIYNYTNRDPLTLRIIAKTGDVVEIRNRVVFINNNPLTSVQIEYPMKKDGKYFTKGYYSVYKEHNNGKEYDIYWSIHETENFGVDNFGRASFSRIDGAPNKITKPYIVPKGYAFAIGDNRDGSFDSRFWGPVPLNNIKGTPMIIWLSTNGWKPRFDRFFRIFYKK